MTTIVKASLVAIALMVAVPAVSAVAAVWDDFPSGMFSESNQISNQEASGTAAALDLEEFGNELSQGE